MKKNKASMMKGHVRLWLYLVFMAGMCRAQEESSMCRTTRYRELPVNLKMEHMCLVAEQTQNEIFAQRQAKFERDNKLLTFLARINNKLNYLLHEMDGDFEDPFSPSDDRTLFNAFLTLKDEHGSEFNLVRKKEWKEFMRWKKRGRDDEESGDKEVIFSSGPCFSDVPMTGAFELPPDQTYPEDCYDILKRGEMSSGVYLIRLFGGRIIPVYCDMDTDGGGWTVFQRRGVNGSVSFNRTWHVYKEGFGNINSDFWLGTEAIHLLSSSRNSSLRVDLWDWEGNRAHAFYKMFYVGNEVDTNYTLMLYGFKGDAGDAFMYHSGSAFSTPDVDNDKWSRHCAKQEGSGWWYNSCAFAALNNAYYNFSLPQYANKKIVDGIIWYHWKESYIYAMSKVEMKTRPTYI